MTQTPAGWYPEPDPAYADRPGRLRYWDGQRWTDHVHEPTPQPPVVPPVVPPPVAPQAPEQGQPPAYPGYQTYGEAQQQYGQQYGQASYGQYQPYGTQPYYQDTRARTPDGVPLAGWWMRVLARILDFLIAIPVYVVAAIPVVVWQWDELSLWFDDLRYAIDNNTPDPPSPDIFDPTTGAGFAFALSLVIGFALYEIVFLRWKQATPGKLITGLRVRQRENPGLPWATLLIRVGFVSAVSAAGQLPLGGLELIFGLFALIDYLWPLWDKKKQAIHDKVAGTNVVKPDRNQSAAPLSAGAAAPRW